MGEGRKGEEEDGREEDGRRRGGRGGDGDGRRGGREGGEGTFAGRVPDAEWADDLADAVLRADPVRPHVPPLDDLRGDDVRLRGLCRALWVLEINLNTTERLLSTFIKKYMSRNNTDKAYITRKTARVNEPKMIK